MKSLKIRTRMATGKSLKILRIRSLFGAARAEGELAHTMPSRERTCAKQICVCVICVSLLIPVAMMAKNPVECPTNYYNNALGKSDQALLTALYNIISSHTTISYDNLWNVYDDSDTDDNGYYIDMYSNYDKFTRSNKCGNYSTIGDCVNREHSLPKSWWGGSKSTQYSDAFHLYPTDGYVNNQRSNYAFGECSSGTRLTNGNYYGKGRLGKSTFSGYTGTVFEPDDEYKGDFARTYFYMVTCYNNVISNWTSGNGSVMFAGNSYPALTTYAINLLMSWHRADPVSEKETKRNNYVYAWQGNRNPFIDHPELAEHIWGNLQGTAWNGGSTATPELTSPADGTTYDMGITHTGKELTLTLTVKGTSLSQPLTVSMTDNEYFAVSSSSLTAASVNAGTTLKVTFTGDDAGAFTNTLTLSSSEVKTTVTITATAVAGIVALPATDIGTTQFTANWENSDNSTGNYLLYVMDEYREPVDGTPITVKASALSYTLTGLESGSDYSYWLVSETDDSFMSNTIEVRTASDVKTVAIEAPADGWTITATQGEASPIKEARVITDNNTDEITLAVDGNFELSRDAVNFAQTLTIAAEGETFYLRLKDTQTVGTYTATLTYACQGIESEDIDLTGHVIAGSLGDVNADGEINIADVNALISIILGNSTEDDYEGECDVNSDGEINISDVNAVIAIILGSSDTGVPAWRAVAAEGGIDVTNPAAEVLEVFDLNAERVAVVSDRACHLTMPAGTYVVASDNFSRKVIVR